MYVGIEYGGTSFARVRCGFEFLLSVLRRYGPNEASTAQEPYDHVSEDGVLTRLKWSPWVGIHEDEHSFRLQGVDSKLRDWHSQMVPVNGLTTLLQRAGSNPDDGNFVVDAGTPNFCWLGGSLLYSKDGLDDLASAVLKWCPEVSAKETECLIAARIAQAANGAAELNLESRKPRRRRVSV